MADSYADVAERLVEELGPFCERTEIAGSIRRGKPDPHDIELVCVPKFAQWAVTGQMEFGAQVPVETFNVLDHELDKLAAAGILADRKDKNERRAWGERFKRAVVYPPHSNRSYALDLFSVIEPAQWGVIFSIRTGPADFSHALVTSRLQGGAMPPDMAAKWGGLYHGGQLVETPEEEDFFRAIGVPCWRPEERSEARLRAWLARERTGARA
jgi:DNA polymerase/3'-5' exonuclease PolX